LSNTFISAKRDIGLLRAKSAYLDAICSF